MNPLRIAVQKSLLSTHKLHTGTNKLKKKIQMSFFLNHLIFLKILLKLITIYDTLHFNLKKYS